MLHLLLVGCGGFLGAIARYKLSELILHTSAQGCIPLGTLTVNVLGCLLVGLLAGAAERYAIFTVEARLFLFTGLLGGFTTFSAFGLEAMQLIRRGDLVTAAIYASTSVILALAAVWLGFKLISLLPR